VIQVRRATLHDLPGAYRVCLLTGDAGMDASSLFRDPDLLGHVYVGPYLVGEPDLALVAADEGGVVGYCLAARDSRALAAWAEREWWPTLRARYPRRDDSSADAKVVELLHHPPTIDDGVLDEYPAELHIDLVARARGAGLGRRLVEAEMAQLAEAGAPGCHLVAATSNTNAIAFYEHLGWRVLQRDHNDTVMGIGLPA
jgi:ribosomal protein S18 acetylase RimI-like enzyme